MGLGSEIRDPGVKEAHPQHWCQLMKACSYGYSGMGGLLSTGRVFVRESALYTTARVI
jgi:hypothetical protein